MQKSKTINEFSSNFVPPKLDTTMHLEEKTLRDEFAMAALQGLLSFHGRDDLKSIEEDAYDIADAMMKQREVK